MYLWRTFAGRHLIFAAVKGHGQNSIAVACTVCSRPLPGDRCVRPSSGHGTCRARRGRGRQRARSGVSRCRQFPAPLVDDDDVYYPGLPGLHLGCFLKHPRFMLTWYKLPHRHAHISSSAAGLNFDHAGEGKTILVQTTVGTSYPAGAYGQSFRNRSVTQFSGHGRLVADQNLKR
jgi:hypothetical protein